MEFFEFAGIVNTAFYDDIYLDYLWAYLLIAALLYAVVYVFEAVALFTIAKRQGYKDRWMAFVPVLNTYYIGVLADKNKVFSRVNPKYFSLAAAIVEGIYVILGILYYVALAQVFGQGYAVPQFEVVILYGAEIEMLTGYEAAASMPQSLEWAWWITSHMQDYILYWLQLVYTLLNIFVIVSFFRTYSSRRYFLFSLFSVILPIQAIFMFAVRNNAGRNYNDYIRECQQNKYRMYQEYMRSQGGNPYQGVSGQSDPYRRQDPYAKRGDSSQDDPFGGLGADKKSDEHRPSDDPFDEF